MSEFLNSPVTFGHLLVLSSGFIGMLLVRLLLAVLDWSLKDRRTDEQIKRDEWRAKHERDESWQRQWDERKQFKFWPQEPPS